MSKKMDLIPRTVVLVKNNEDKYFNLGSTTQQETMPLESLRNQDAWVLLGEPGAGKSTAFEQEAQACGGKYLSVQEFLSSELNRPSPCLFLDALDEASGCPKETIYKVAKQLTALGNPKFRIACRAADWLSHTNAQALKNLLNRDNGVLAVYALNPFSDEDIRTYLQNNLDGDTEKFYQQAQEQGMTVVLRNPEMLKQMVAAFKAGKMPKNKKDLFALTCELLLTEHNETYLDQEWLPNTTGNKPTNKQLMNAAGFMMALLLLGGKEGISKKSGSLNDLAWKNVSENVPQNLNAGTIQNALKTKLFTTTQHVETLKPCHRTTAEYLAGHYLADCIDHHGLPLLRVQGVLGLDNTVHTPLRGVFAWLAMHSSTAQSTQSTLINTDPLSILLYGDVAALTPSAKLAMVLAMKKVLQENPNAFWEIVQHPRNPLPDLFSNEHCEQYFNLLEQPTLHEHEQAHHSFILKILKANANKLQHKQANLLTLVKDTQRWPAVRRYALETWLGTGVGKKEIKEWLDKLYTGLVQDLEKDLTASLLQNAYEHGFSALELVPYLHIRRSNRISSYESFWKNKFVKQMPAEQVPQVLDALHNREELWGYEPRPSTHQERLLSQYHFWPHLMLSKLLTKGIEQHGDSITDERLFNWLRLGTDQNGDFSRHRTDTTMIREWLSQRPQRYKALLGLCYQASANPINNTKDDTYHPTTRLYFLEHLFRAATPPHDLGQWHLQHVDQTTDESLAQHHLEKAVYALIKKEDNHGLRLEDIENWAGTDPKKLSWLANAKAYLDPNNQQHNNNDERHQKNELRAEQHRLKNTQDITPHLPAIAKGTAPAGLMHNLANVWFNYDPLEKLNQEFSNGREVYEAAQQGFMACLNQPTLPTAQDILSKFAEKKFIPFQTPCLVGLELLCKHQGTENVLNSLPTSTVNTLLLFLLTNFPEPAKIPAWFLHVLENKPEQVCNALVPLAKTSLKSDAYTPLIYQMAREPKYKPLAFLAVPQLLQSYPTRSPVDARRNFQELLATALRYNMPELPSIIVEKLQCNSLDKKQRVLFLLAGSAIEPTTYRIKFRQFTEKKSERIHWAINFIDRYHHLLWPENTDTKTLGLLIETWAPFATNHDLQRFANQLIDRENPHNIETRLQEIDRLLSLNLNAVHEQLRYGRAELAQMLRQQHFAYPSPTTLAQLLSNGPPASSQDLQALVLSRLDWLAKHMHNNNANLYRQFWTLDKKNNTHKDENDCRDTLLFLLRPNLASQLDTHKVQYEPEMSSAGDKRMDIRALSACQRFTIPIEIKGVWHKDLWTAAQTQLKKYAQEPRADGYGIYLVLWTGQKQIKPEDGKPKAQSPEKLQERLSQHLAPELRDRLVVRVLDISYPSKTLTPAPPTP